MNLKTLPNTSILDRDDINNRILLSNCAALSFHKAIIGLTELNALEMLSADSVAGGFRISKAINTYYIVYHLFCSLMLLDTNYEYELKKYKRVNDSIEFYINESDLNDGNELPQTWNNCREYENDLSSLISHSEIKKYCSKLRINPPSRYDEYLILYQNFIYVNELRPNESIKGLYEKICYIRDRCIYRPSIVYDKEGNKYQTSLNVRREIDNLPNSSELFNIIISIYIKIKEKANTNDTYSHSFIFSLWNDIVEDDKDYLVSLGYTLDDINGLAQIYNSNEVYLNSYLCQYIEIANYERVIDGLSNYWNYLKSL